MYDIRRIIPWYTVWHVWLTRLHLPRSYLLDDNLPVFFLRYYYFQFTARFNNRITYCYENKKKKILPEITTNNFPEEIHNASIMSPGNTYRSVMLGIKSDMMGPFSLLGLYSLSGGTSYHKISWSLEAAWFGFRLFQSLWNLAGTSAAALPKCLPNVRAIRSLWHHILRLRVSTRSYGKTSVRFVNGGPREHQVVSLLKANQKGRQMAFCSVHKETGSSIYVIEYAYFPLRSYSHPAANEVILQNVGY